MNPDYDYFGSALAPPTDSFSEKKIDISVPKLSISIHSGLLDNWPLLQNLIKSFLVCNHYPNVELMLVESGGNKEIRDWFENMDFDDYFRNLDGQQTTLKKYPSVSIQKTLKFIDFDPPVKGLGCYTRAITECTTSFNGDFNVILAEDNQFIIKGDIVSDFLALLNHFGPTQTIVYFFTQQKYKLYKENNLSSGPHQIDDTKILFFVPHQAKWDVGGISSKALHDKLNLERKKIGVDEESVWDIHHGLMHQYINLVKSIEGFKRIYPAIPAGVWMPNENQAVLKNQITTKTKNNPDYLLYRTVEKSSMLQTVNQHVFTRPFSSEDYSVEN